MKYISVSEFYKNHFGTKVYKLSVDGGCTCPTRDGTLGTDGCIFCSAAGSGDFVPSKSLSITQQITEAKKLVDSKFSRKKIADAEKKYIVYFQNFTNTYGNPEELISKYKEALSSPNVVGIAIGTRSDCIPEEILEYLGKVSENKFVQVELGLQTSKESSAEYIRRHYKNEVYANAVERLHKAGNIHVVTHIIFGIPGETKEDMMNTVKFAVACGTDGIKIASLYVLKGTDLAKEYAEGKFKALEMEEYFDLVKAALSYIPENLVIHRLTGDGPKALLIAPLWTGDKKKVLNEMNRVMK